METGILPKPEMICLPMLFPGEMATTFIEPLRSLMGEVETTDEVEGVWCASYFNGMAWVDAPHSRASLVVVSESRIIATREARRLAKLFWDARGQFRFEEETAVPEAALDLAAASNCAPVFITDSGDNLTAGAPGDSIW